jgi:hypothetical protein
VGEVTDVIEIRSEDHLKAKVIDLCKQLGLLVYSIPDSRRMEGSPGFPDLVIASVDGSGVLFVELKDQHGRLSEKQTVWKWALKASGEAWRLWRPSDWPAIQGELRSIA